METKICYKCKKELPVEFFEKNRTRKDGLQSACKKCKKEYIKEHYLKNKQIYLDRSLKKNKELREWFEEYKQNLSCEKCGDRRWYVLEFHHKNPEEKDLAVSQLVTYGKNRILKEISKCIVLCANCHREHHYLNK